jgi:Ca2+-binding EF-hand superfamily protein
MRYLGRFPSEAQIQLIMVQLLEDPNSETLTFDRVELYLLDVLQSNDFLPASFEGLINCFKRFDPKNTGMIKIEKFKIVVKECK